MILKAISGFFFGLMLILPLDFLFFIGLKKHYFDFYKIDVYFNIYFFDNQPFIWIIIASLVFGTMLLYTPLRKVLQISYLLILLVFFSMLFRQVGREIGSNLFKAENVKCKLGKYEFKADILYIGRNNYFLKRKGNPRAVKISKKELQIN